ncbi:MAG: lactate permease [Verrucomicrobia bacterium]|nr:lactate permease [Verrucomicrobiota bacterium]
MMSDVFGMPPGLVGLIPLLLLFIGLGFTRIPAYVVAITAALISIVMASAGWKASTPAIAWAGLEGAVTALVPIVWVILSAVFIFLVSTETKAINTFRHFLSGVTPDPSLQAVLIAFCLGGFLEAVAGFGSAVAVPAGMLIALGFKPIKAVVLSLVANSVPVAFGALGIPLLALVKVTNLETSILSKNVAVQLAAPAILVPAVLVLMTHQGWKGIGRPIAESLFIGLVFSGTQVLLAWTVGPELVAIGGSLASLLVYVAYRRCISSPPPSPREQVAPNLAMAAMPFACLLAMVLLTRLTALRVLQKEPFALVVGPDAHRMTLDLITTPGTLLMISALIGAAAGGLSFRRTWQILCEATWKIRWTAVIVVSILMMAKVMTCSGMITSVAMMLADGAGVFFPLISPWLGAIGTFVTGSDTSSNILLGALQKETAINTGFDPAWISAANTSGATAGKMISPQSISVGASTAGIESQQGEILRTTIWYCAGYLVLLCIIIYVGATLGLGATH